MSSSYALVDTAHRPSAASGDDARRLRTSRRTSRRGSRRGSRRALAVAIVWLGAGACVGNPASEISQAELMLDISDAVAALRAENAFLQDQVDSLHIAVARQDTLLRRVAAATGVSIAGP